jgi:hypothetical protein
VLREQALKSSAIRFSPQEHARILPHRQYELTPNPRKPVFVTIILPAKIRIPAEDPGENATRRQFAADTFISDIQKVYRSVCFLSDSQHAQPRRLAVKLSAD